MKNERKYIKLTDEKLKKFCGHYLCEESLLAHKIILRKNKLFYQTSKKIKFELIPIRTNEFHFKDKEVEKNLKFKTRGKINTLTIHEKDEEDKYFIEYSPKVFDPVKFLANTIESTHGSVFKDPYDLLGYLNFFANFRKERIKHKLSHSDQSALTFIPLKDKSVNLSKTGLITSDSTSKPLPKLEEDIAFAPLADLAEWIKSRKLTSLRLTKIYLNRLKKYNKVLNCVMTMTEEHALKQARKADNEIKNGKYRGMLHGIPYGVKDIVDTAGILTTWGVEFYRNRIPKEDAKIIELFNEAGAILIAKLALGRVSGHIESFIGDTKTPWDIKESAGLSSSGSGAATSAGLVGFSIGSEIGGSIAAPSEYCGIAGMRSSFGRISQTGVFTYGSVDKLGPMCRTAEDVATVLSVVSKYDEKDIYSQPIPFYFNAKSKLPKLTAGFNPEWFEGDDSKDIRLNILEQIGDMFELVEFSNSDIDINPDLEAKINQHMLGGEAGLVLDDFYYANCDEINDKDDIALLRTSPHRLLSSLEFNHVQQLRRKTMIKIQNLFEMVDFIIVPPGTYPSSQIFNSTGHPTLSIPCALKGVDTFGITLIGRMYDEATLCKIGMKIEKMFNFLDNRPQSYKQE